MNRINLARVSPDGLYIELDAVSSDGKVFVDLLIRHYKSDKYVSFREVLVGLTDTLVLRIATELIPGTIEDGKNMYYIRLVSKEPSEEDDTEDEFIEQEVGGVALYSEEDPNENEEEEDEEEEGDVEEDDGEDIDSDDLELEYSEEYTLEYIMNIEKFDAVISNVNAVYRALRSKILELNARNINKNDYYALHRLYMLLYAHEQSMYYGYVGSPSEAESTYDLLMEELSADKSILRGIDGPIYKEL